MAMENGPMKKVERFFFCLCFGLLYLFAGQAGAAVQIKANTGTQIERYSQTSLAITAPMLYSAVGQNTGGDTGGSTIPDSPEILFSDDFSTNQNKWRLWTNGTYYDAFFQSGAYVMDRKSDGSSVEWVQKQLYLPDNFDVELTTTWKSGIKNYAYGLSIGSDGNNRYIFSLAGDGSAGVVGYIDNKVIDPMPLRWKSGQARVGDGSSRNVIRIEVRGRTISFYVNNRYQGVVNSAIAHLKIGLSSTARQVVAFDDIIITAR